MARWFADLKLAWKIALPGVFLAVVAAFVAWQALGALSSTNTIASNVLDSSVREALLANDAALHAVSFKVDMRDRVLAATPEGQAKAENAYNADMLAVRSSLNRLSVLETSQERKAEIGTVGDDLTSYATVARNVFAYGKSKTSGETYAYIVANLLPVNKKLVAGFDGLAKGVQNDIAGQRSALSAIASAAYWRVLIETLLGFAAGLTVLFLVAMYQVAKPVGRVSEALKTLAEGHLDIAVEGTDRLDEVGVLATAAQRFKDAALAERLRATENLAQEQARAVEITNVVAIIGDGLGALAKGDLTHRVSADLKGSFARLKEDFNSALARVEELVQTVLATAGNIKTGADEIADAANDLSTRTEQQAASLEETAAALEEITATVKRTAQNATETNTAVTSAREAAEEGGKVAETAITAIGQIQQSSKQITDIIGIIDEIAFQTNLLALNAGVEAARAGDAGKGFAVVASEVRALAQRSGEAAKQIKGLIKASNDHVAAGVGFVVESGTVLKRIHEQVAKINAVIADMAQAAGEQSRGIEEVNIAVGQMDRMTQQNAAMVEQSTAASRSLANEMSQLSRLVSVFRVGSTGPAGPHRRHGDENCAQLAQVA